MNLTYRGTVYHVDTEEELLQLLFALNVLRVLAA